MPAPLPATEITALLGRGTHFEGKLQFEGRVRIDGSFRGEIRSADTLVIGDGAEVEAEIDVAVVIIKGGTVRGNVRATRSIELYVPARVSGTLHSPRDFHGQGGAILRDLHDGPRARERLTTRCGALALCCFCNTGRQ